MIAIKRGHQQLTSNLPAELSSGNGYDGRGRFASSPDLAAGARFSAYLPHSTARSTQLFREKLWI